MSLPTFQTVSTPQRPDLEGPPGPRPTGRDLQGLRGPSFCQDLRLGKIGTITTSVAHGLGFSGSGVTDGHNSVHKSISQVSRVKKSYNKQMKLMIENIHR